MALRHSLMIKVSGSAVEMEDLSLDIAYLKRFADFIAELTSTFVISVTIGGGALARKYISTARALGQPDSFASLLGGDAGLLNCRLVICALLSRGIPIHNSPVESWDVAREIMLSGRIPMLYGRWPALTSDSVAAYFADYATMSMMLKLSCVDAIYDKDPRSHPDAKPQRFITHEQLEDMAMYHDTRRSGGHFVIDFLAAKRLRHSRVPMLLQHKDNLTSTAKLLARYHWQDLDDGSLVGDVADAT